MHHAVEILADGRRKLIQPFLVQPWRPCCEIDGGSGDFHLRLEFEPYRKCDREIVIRCIRAGARYIAYPHPRGRCRHVRNRYPCETSVVRSRRDDCLNIGDKIVGGPFDLNIGDRESARIPCDFIGHRFPEGLSAIRTDNRYRRLFFLDNRAVESEKCSEWTIRGWNFRQAIFIVVTLRFGDNPEKMAFRGCKRTCIGFDMPRRIMIATKGCVCLEIEFCNRRKYARFNFYGRWLFFPCESVYVEDQFSSRSVRFIEPDVGRLRNRYRYRLVAMIRSVTSGRIRSLFLPAARDHQSEHKPDTAWRQRKFKFHQTSIGGLEDALVIFAGCQEVPQVAVRFKSLCVIFIRIEKRVTGIVLESAGTVAENQLCSEFGGVKPSAETVGVFHPEIGPSMPDRQVFIFQNVSAVPNDDAHQVICLVLVDSRKRVMDLQLDVDSQE